MVKTKFQSARNPRKRFYVNKWWLVSCFTVLVLAVPILELTDTTYLFHRKKAVSSTIASPSSSNSPSSSSNKGNSLASPSSNQTSTDTSAKAGTATSGNNSPLLVPYGNFVSNHNPGQDGAPTTETSVCITTPGASCYIKFTNGDGVVKTLAAGTVDSTGAVYWNNWDVKTAGFTNGTWQIEAVASLNDQTKSTKDDKPLQVQL